MSLGKTDMAAGASFGHDQQMLQFKKVVQLLNFFGRNRAQIAPRD